MTNFIFGVIVGAFWPLWIALIEPFVYTAGYIYGCLRCVYRTKGVKPVLETVFHWTFYRWAWKVWWSRISNGHHAWIYSQTFKNGDRWRRYFKYEKHDEEKQ